ncbi:MAG TPA: outer membrane beta-barrel protein [Chitinophagaceae bacterium]|jgi:hypothetical protein|nr:outer membrane beta-barrel protein [Chitinophagaceae bacterium]HMU58979.1 outer membrane beta-barrel protein [Chitinophagaceae bacterium]
MLLKSYLITVLMAACLVVKGQMDYFDGSKSTLVLKPSLNSSTIQIKAPGVDGQSPTQRIGYGLGLEYWQKLNKSFFLSGGLHFNSFGYKNARTSYLNTPFLLNYNTKNDKFTFGGGVYAGMAISGKYKSLTTGWEKLKLGESSTDNRSRIDFGVALNARFDFWLLSFLNFNYYLGIKDLTPKERQSSTEPTRKMAALSVSFALPVSELMK